MAFNDGVAEDPDRQFRVGDHVRIVRQNSDAKCPADAAHIGDFSGIPLGYETFLGEYEGDQIQRGYELEDEYDPDDNTWKVWFKDSDGDWGYDWVREGAMELIQPLTQEDEDEAIASIMKALAPRHLPLTEDGYRRNAEDCPACDLAKMPYPYICPGPEGDQ